MIGKTIGALRLRTRIIILLVGLLFVSLGLNIAVTEYQQMRQAEGEMVEKARILSKQMTAVWDFIDDKQDIIDTDADGTYNFKGLSCAIAGKEISKKLSGETDYTIKYTNATTRKEGDSPDSFEKEALAAYSSDPELGEYYRLLTEGEQVFRYTSPLWIEESCLGCHGDPIGELDVLGYPKEGMKKGDLAGIMSISMPVDLYMSGIQENITRQVVYVFLVTSGVVALIFWAFSRLVTRPLSLLEAAAVHIEDGGYDPPLDTVAFQGEIKDLADRFQSMSEKLKSVHEDLESQVADRTERIAEANAILESQRSQLQKANELLSRESEYKSDFLATVSHELRTPLTSILAYVDLWESSRDHVDESERQSLSEIKENSRILLGMVNNILDMARAEAGKIEVIPEPLDMVDLVNEVERLVVPIAVKKGLHLSVRVDPEVPIIYADREKVRRIVENLVSNAIKFTPEGGAVAISVDSDPRAPLERIRIQVSDAGVGISEDDSDAVFERFWQESGRANRASGGSGLGLAVVKQFVENLGGEARVASEKGKGSTFEVVLPIGSGAWEEME